MKIFSEENKTDFYEHYFDDNDYHVFRYDVGSMCTRNFILKHVVHSSGRMLEVGTGISSLLEDAPSFERFGADISSQTIATVSHLFAQKNIPAQLFFADAEKLPFQDNFFDVIVSSHTFEHINNDQQAFNECIRVLKPGGELILFVPGRISGRSTPEEFESLGHYRMYNASRLNAFVSQNHSAQLTTLVYPHKVHNLVWNKLKTLCRWFNYPFKKWIMRDNKSYEERVFYQRYIQPLLCSAFNYVDQFFLTQEKNLLTAEFNVLARYQKI